MQDVIQRPEVAFLVVLAGAISLRSMALRRRAALAVSALALAIAALPLLSVVGALALASSGGLLLWLARLARARRPVRPPFTTQPVPGRVAALLVVSLLATALGRDLSLVFLGAAIASWAGWLIARSWSGARWPVVPAILTLILLGTYFFMHTIAGPEGLSMSVLPALPVSPAAETLLAASLLSSSWLLTGLWPVQRLSAGPFTAPAGALLLVQVGLVVSPVGMEHWRALAAPLVMLGIWQAAAARWWPGLAVGGAWLALVSVDPSGIAAGTWLLPAAVALALVGPEREGETVLRRAARGVGLLAAGWGGLLALEAGLHGEVVYTLLAAAGAVLGISARDHAMTPSEPRSTAPSA